MRSAIEPAWMTSGAARIAPAPAPSRGARRAVCGDRCKAFRRPHRHSAVRPARAGCPSARPWPKGRRLSSLPSAAGLRRRRFAAPPLPEGGSSSAGPPSRDRRGTRPSCSRAGRGSGSWTASRAGAAAKPANAASRASGAGPGRRRPVSCTLPILDGGSGAGRHALLVSDANRCYPPVAAALAIPHETINRSAGERVRGAVHIQTVNSRHSQIKGFLRPWGIATKYLDSYLRWFHLIELADRPPPRACLTAAMAKPCLRFAN